MQLTAGPGPKDETQLFLYQEFTVYIALNVSKQLLFNRELKLSTFDLKFVQGLESNGIT
jgi:hypothetical protein